MAFGEKSHDVHDKKVQQYLPTTKFLLSWSHGKHQGRLRLYIDLAKLKSGALIGLFSNPTLH